MSLTKISIRNFQSLRQVDLELGLFTVIVGPSSSGKSALIRAFKALASNVRGSGFITRGQSTMAITGHTETRAVTLVRTERSGSYQILDGAGGLHTFTKLAGEVPPQVTQALGIEPVPATGTNVNFASQFDKPYLLDESGAVIARELGELTNVNQVFEAVRAANRIRSAAASKLKTRKEDLEQVKTKLKGFQSLSGDLRALEAIESDDADRRELEKRISRLSTAIKTVRVAQRALDKAANLPDVPDARPLADVHRRYQALARQLLAIRTLRNQVETATLRADLASDDLLHHRQSLADRLAESTLCPTCGQPVTATDEVQTG